MTDKLENTTPGTNAGITGEFATTKTRRGFALMDASQLRAVSSKGGSAPHASKRGFALMDENRLREVSQKGLLARRGALVPDSVGALPPVDDQAGNA